MSAASRAVIFSARHEERIVFLCAYCAVENIVKAWPACAAIVFRLAIEEREITTRAMERAVAFFVVERGREWALCAFFTQNAVGERRKALFPFRIRDLAPFAIGEGFTAITCNAFTRAARTGSKEGGRGAHQEGSAGPF